MPFASNKGRKAHRLQSGKAAAQQAASSSPGQLFLLFMPTVRTPLVFFALLFSLSSWFVTQVRGHTAGSPAPLPTTVRASIIIARRLSGFSSLVDEKTFSLFFPRRLASNIYHDAVTRDNNDCCCNFASQVESYTVWDQLRPPAATSRRLSPRVTASALVAWQSTRHLVAESKYPGKI